METIVLGGLFANATRYLGRYFAQADALRAALEARGQHLRLVLVEGDSRDQTWRELHRLSAGFDAEIIKRSHGGPIFGSVEHPQRFKQLAYCSNAVLQSVRETDSVLAFIETDLIWDAATLVKLIDHTKTYPVCGPLTMAAQAHYDTWGCRWLNGERLGSFAHRDIGTDMLELACIGSCIVMRAEVARNVVIPEEDHWVGFGTECRRQGYSVWLDPTCRINHPV